jgi:UDP:flavonoid glycosyltransferase YjiC (YdhE family)
MKEVYGNDLPYAGELENLMQIAFVNSHPSIEFAESLPPNVIEVAGLHLRDSKPLDKDLDDFLSAGKKGSVIMSLGTNFRSDTLGEAKITAIVEAFRELKDYNFIWKFETSDQIKNLPSNVRIQPWLSQNDILGHSNVKAFITHGGMLSLQETVYHGKPFIGIPLFSDQMRNVQNSIYGGVAIKIDFDKISKEGVKKSVLEILENRKYKINMENRSKLFRDQPRKPLDLALWWCEYIMRNPNSNHLKPVEFNYGFLGSQFWDVQCILILIIILIYYNVKWVLLKLFKRKPVDVKIKRN